MASEDWFVGVDVIAEKHKGHGDGSTSATLSVSGSCSKCPRCFNAPIILYRNPSVGELFGRIDKVKAVAFHKGWRVRNGKWVCDRCEQGRASKPAPGSRVDVEG